MADKKNEIQPIHGSFEEVVNSIVPKVTKTAPADLLGSSDFEVVVYSSQGETDPVAFRLDAETESIWATQAQMADLFQTDVSNISRHLKSIFESGELNENNSLRKLQIDNSKKPVTVYSLDAVISVGYRVNSKAATKFRQWATKTIKAYIEQGYVINDKALRESPEKLNRLAAEIRALRSEEKNVFAKVRECFKVGSSDYEPSSKEVRKFYALLQDKFHYAVTGQTGSKLKMDRADHRVDNMGVQSFSGKNPTMKEAQTGKNYLLSDELYRLYLLSEQFLLFAESTALAGREMTMVSLHRQLDRLLELNDYPVFDGWKDFLRDSAERHVRQEMTLYKKRQKIESIGMEYDEEALAAGEYDDILIDA